MSAHTSETPPRGVSAPLESGALAAVVDWPLEPTVPGRVASGVLAWALARRRDLVALGAVLVPLTVVHAWGMGVFPAFFDDEGAYVSQAFAVDRLHALAPYTYWYDHPPLGWLFLAAWAKVFPVFTSGSFAIGAERTFMLFVFVASGALVYGVARRIPLGPALSAVALALFGLSPLALHYQRMVLLDNLALPWLLAACFLALSPRSRLLAYAGSGVCFAVACLTKETFLLFLPALLLAVRASSPPATRRFSVVVFGTLFFSSAAFYPLFALLRGELFEGKHHTSLLAGIQFQLSRRGGGSVFNGHSITRSIVDTWLHLDPIVLVSALALIPTLLAIRRLRWIGVALAVPVLMAVRPGSYVPAMFVIGILPFVALGLAGLAGEATRVSRNEARKPAIRTAVATLAVVVLAIPVGIAAPLWLKRDASMMTTNDVSADQRAVDWLSAHANRNSRILVDGTAWTDLVDRGFDRHRIVWFYKLDLDPAVRTPWWKFDYVIRSNQLVANIVWLPRSRAVYQHSRLVAVFRTPHELIEVRRVVRKTTA